jgi:hypothetical protein
VRELAFLAPAVPLVDDRERAAQSDSLDRMERDLEREVIVRRLGQLRLDHGLAPAQPLAVQAHQLDALLQHLLVGAPVRASLAAQQARTAAAPSLPMLFMDCARDHPGLGSPQPARELRP